MAKAVKPTARAAAKTASRPKSAGGVKIPVARARVAAPIPKTPAKTASRAAVKAVPAKALAKPAGSAAPPAAKTPVKTLPAVKAVAGRTAKAVEKPAERPAKKPVLDKFMLEQRDLLQEQLAAHMSQAQALKDEADALAREMEPGESEFGEEGGEGGTLSVERELDLVLSAQAKAAVDEIERALAKIEAGTYGLCEKCGKEIPRARLRALPHAPLCVACKSGGLSRR